MGMDVSGMNPTSDRGSYFRNNVWWWRPLAEYCLNNHFEIAGKCESWHTNDGAGLDEENSKLLARALKEDLRRGVVADYEKEYNRQMGELPREVCRLCEGTGIRSDMLGKEMGMPEKELKPEVQILTGRTHGWCNACDGVGTTENWALSYPFNEENVREFADFLEDCGGFSIY